MVVVFKSEFLMVTSTCGAIVFAQNSVSVNDLSGGKCN